MNETDFRKALHACLDARRDPLDDAGLCAYFDAHPEQLEAFAALRERLAALPGAFATAAVGRRPAPSHLRLASTIVIAAAAALAVLWPTNLSTARPARGILAASFEEVRPRADAAVSFTVRQSWPTASWQVSPDSILETYVMRSERR